MIVLLRTQGPVRAGERFTELQLQIETSVRDMNDRLEARIKELEASFEARFAELSARLDICMNWPTTVIDGLEVQSDALNLPGGFFAS